MIFFASRSENYAICYNCDLMDTQDVYDGEEFANEEYSPLIRACYEGNEDRVNALLKEGAHIEEKDEEGRTPLFYACWISRNEKIINKLISYGADPNVADIEGTSPLMWSCLRGGCFLNIIELFNNGADINSADHKGETPLMHACQSGSPRTVRILLERGAQLDATDNVGKSPLVHALEAPDDVNLEIITYLFDYGAELKTRTKEEDNNLRDSFSRYVIDYVKEIEERRTKPRHMWGGCPIMFSIRIASLTVSQYLYEDEDIENDMFKNLSPLLYAGLTTNITLIQELLNQKGSFFSPDYKDDSICKDYQEDILKMANSYHKNIKGAKR